MYVLEKGHVLVGILPPAESRQTGRRPQVIFVVLGMHKSGTTLVSQILHHSGIHMGNFSKEISYDMGNKYERQSCLDLNLAILEALDYEVLHLTSGLEMHLKPAQRETMRKLISECETGHDDWGFKDPRCCLTYHLWAEELPDHKLIVVYRNPEQIWQRFKWRGLRKYHTNFHRAYEFLKRWHEHNLNIMEILEKTNQDYLVVNYHDFMSGETGFRRLEQLVGRPLDDRRRQDLYRSQNAGDVFLKLGDWLLTRQRGWSISGTMARLAELEETATGKETQN